MPASDSTKFNQIVAEARQRRQQQEKGYREKALKLFPSICARCGREFEGKKLRELTVHHKDHNHDNNPPDGSNWELLNTTVRQWPMRTIRARRTGKPIHLSTTSPLPDSKSC